MLKLQSISLSKLGKSHSEDYRYFSGYFALGALRLKYIIIISSMTSIYLCIINLIHFIFPISRHQWLILVCVRLLQLIEFLTVKLYKKVLL